MTSEKLLDALNDIDGKAIREARAAGKQLPRRRFAVLIAAVIALTAMTVTAFASEEIAGWFRQYFARQTGTDLSPKQIEYIEANEQIVAQELECCGYTVKLKSYLTDGEVTYVTLGVTAPEDVALNQWGSLSCYDGIEVTDERGYPPFSWGFEVENDPDGHDNTANVVIPIRPGDWNTGSVWNIRIDALYTTFYDEAYEQELMQTKYAGQTEVMFTNEESARIHQHPLLAEGPWSFTINTAGSSEELELLTAPVTVQASVRRHGSDDITSDDYFVYTTEDVTITSVIVRPLSVSICYESDGVVQFADEVDEEVYAVLKDGTSIRLHTGNSNADGEDTLVPDTPIVLDEVDHILLADGSKLTTP